MSPKVSDLAGRPAPKSILVDVAKLLAAYVDLRPDPAEPSQRVAFGTSGHRGNPLEQSFNEWHILAITQAICAHRKTKGIDGPLFITSCITIHGTCDLHGTCTIKEPLSKVNDTISNVLKAIRIADLVDAIPYDRRAHVNGGHGRPLVTLG